MMFNATFNNFSVISLRLVLLVWTTEVPGEISPTYIPQFKFIDKLYHIMLDRAGYYVSSGLLNYNISSKL
jgi:hypothetical protein